MKERKIFDKKNPNAGGKQFIPLPKDAMHYVHHPEMRPNMLMLYAIIIDRYNDDKGFAFPSLNSLAVDYGMSRNITSNHIEILKKVGLIDYPEKGYYVPLVPLDETEFYREFPEAWDAYLKAHRQAEGRRKSDRERLRRWRKESFE